MKVTIFDYGAGNLHSLAKAVAVAGGEPVVEDDPIRFAEGSVLVLPGVGAFGPAAARLGPALPRLRQALRAGRPCLGICLGMQLLFEGSDEGEGEGIGLLEGRITRLEAERVPQIGWNEIDEITDPTVLRSGLRQAYYANSYVARPTRQERIGGWSGYQGDRFAAVVSEAATLGVQFHPEKSSFAGVALIRAFLDRSRS